MPAPHRSKTLTALLAFTLGIVGGHRFYLYGSRDLYAWLHAAATLLGLCGLILLRHSELHSAPGWVGAIIGSIGWLAAWLSVLVYGLRPDEQWDAQFNPNSGRQSRSGWMVILTVIATLMLGAGLLMAGFAISFQTFFESQIEAARQLSQDE